MQATLYNHYWDKEADCDRYQRTVINLIHACGERRIIIGSKTISTEDAFTFYIPLHGAANGKTYVAPADFEVLKDKAGYWTLAKEDMIVRDVCDVEGDRKSELTEAGCLQVTDVKVLDYGSSNMQHFKVVAS